MSDKGFIETLKNIKKYCEDAASCQKCKFSHGSLSLCRLAELGEELEKLPEDWNIEKIERIIKDE